jgi:hypothetical protein
MAGASLAELVTDWGGFEKLIAELNQTGDVTVEHNVVLQGRSGAPRQIDVLIRHTKGLYEHLVIIECKYWNDSVERLHVDALATTVREVGASRGVIFSTKGFQSGAITQAEHESIDLFTVREPTTEEWGRPGRHIDFYMHFISLSVGNPDLHGAFMLGGPRPSSTNLNITFGDDEHTSRTPIRAEGKSDTTLEGLIERLARESAPKAYQPWRLSFEGKDECEARFKMKVNLEPKTPVEISVHGGKIFVPKLSFEVGVKIDQTRFQLDRAKNYTFVLAVEDCVRRQVSAASRRDGDAQTVLSPLKPTADDTREVLQNGSIMQIWLKPIIQFQDFADLELGKVVLGPRTGNVDASRADNTAGNVA